MTLLAREHELTAQLLILPDAQERLSALVARASRLPGLDATECVEENLVRGCVSPVWLAKSQAQGKCHFRVQADSPLVAGLVALLAELCDGSDPTELVAFQPRIWEDLGIWRNLSPTRQNGLLAVVAAMQHFAKSCL